MDRVVEFYFDYGSPYSYLAYARLPEVLRRAGARAAYRPMLLGGVFQATGNSSPALNKAKWAQSTRDLDRNAAKYAVPYRSNPHFIVNTLKLMRGAVVAAEEGYLERYSDAAFAGMWRHAKKMDEDAVIAEVLAAAGLDGGRILVRIAEDRVKQTLKSWTEAAVQRGVFGAPSFFVGDEMFFGQDRLDFVEDALSGRFWRNAREAGGSR
jgi:2-hydroxychromene-2-carboxylate isomerase